jgi:multicomponent Na+:H+ antiporter subunit B
MSGFATPIDAGFLVNAALLAMLLAVVVGIIATRSLIGAVLLMSLYSLISATWLLVMDAADVAFTEAVVGAGASTVILLGALLLTRARTVPAPRVQLIAPFIAVLLAGGLLIYASFDLPMLGDPASPANAHVGRAYMERVDEDVGTPNVVTAVLSSYRGLDTLGETAVVFAAGLAVALLLGFGERAMQDEPRAQWLERRETLADTDHHAILRVTSKLIVPITLMFALYVQFHGDLGAGGGFQAGVLAAVAVIQHALVFGLRDTMRAVPASLVRAVASLGVLVFGGAGVASILQGGVFLDYDFLLPPSFEAGLPDSAIAGGHHHWGQHFGIMVIELGVLLTVAATLVAIYYAFAGRISDIPPEEAA